MKSKKNIIKYPVIISLINGTLAVADSKGVVRFGDFISDLKKAGASEAL